MLFSIKTDEFLGRLNLVNQVIPRHTIFPILSNIRIEVKEEKMHIFGTDLDTSMSYTTNLVDVEEEGVMIVPAKTLYSMMREIKGKATFVQEGNRVKTEYGHGYFYLPLMEEEDFPSEPTISKESAHKVNINEIKKSIDKLVFIVPEDSAKRNMSGMLWEYKEGNLKMVVTDSFSLGYSNTEVDLGKEPFNMVIPPKILKQVSSVECEEMWIGVDESRVCFIGDNFTMVSNLIKVDFPNYRSAIPENNKNILKVEKDLFISSLKRVSVFSDDKPKTVILNIGKELTIGASSEIGEGKEEINAEYEGSELNIALSSNYLIDFLRQIDSVNAILSFGEEDRPVIIEGETKEIFYLLMPVMLE